MVTCIRAYTSFSICSFCSDFEEAAASGRNANHSIVMALQLGSTYRRILSPKPYLAKSVSTSSRVSSDPCRNEIRRQPAVPPPNETEDALPSSESRSISDLYSRKGSVGVESSCSGKSLRNIMEILVSSDEEKVKDDVVSVRKKMLAKMKAEWKTFRDGGILGQKMNLLEENKGKRGGWVESLREMFDKETIDSTEELGDVNEKENGGAAILKLGEMEKRRSIGISVMKLGDGKAKDEEDWADELGELVEKKDEIEELGQLTETEDNEIVNSVGGPSFSNFKDTLQMLKTVKKTLRKGGRTKGKARKV